MSVYWSLISASIRGQMAYRRSFLLETCGRTIITILELIAIFFLYDHISDLRGWTQWEVVYLYGVASISMGIGEMLTSGLDEMPEMVREGKFDQLLVRPVSPLVQMLGRNLRLFLVGRR